MAGIRIQEVDDRALGTAVDLLDRFFREEGFGTPRAEVAANAARLLRDPHHWVALAWDGGRAVGVVTVSSVLYVEWGRLGEIGDLYVLPEMRRRGIARALIEAGIARCRALGCSAVGVTITPQGERTHGLGRFYAKLGFVELGRASAVLRL
ncbi:MAG: GNAT family N-acetyltransferase [Alphaproteobacteria bacterium]|nr:GNAT family N-acetyltransferase [Alphaproteobacteria bacterium]